MAKFIKWVFIFFAFSVLIGLGTSYHYIYSPGDGESSVTVIFDVKPKTSLLQIVTDLEKEGLVKDSKLFYYFIRLVHRGESVKAGEYELKRSYSPSEIWNTIASGRSIERIFTVREGMNSYEIAKKFEADGLGSSEEFLRIVHDQSHTKDFLKFEVRSLEGFLYPETYKIGKYIGARELISIMTRMSLKNIEQVRKEFPTKLTVLQHLTMASIIEKESGVPEERRLISSVIFNRLEKGMKLQMDPTVIYGYWRKTGTYIENIRRQDLLEPNEFNTYSFYGLPAGPISNPGREAIVAAVNPEKSNYLYFVSKNDGTHTFSESLKDHNKAVSQFQIDKKAREGKSWRELKSKNKSKKTRTKK